MTALTGETLDQVFETIAKRHREFKDGKVGNSRTAKLFKRGSAKIAQKLGEEAVETVIEKKVSRDLIPALKAMGAEGIVEYPLNKVVP